MNYNDAMLYSTQSELPTQDVSRLDLLKSQLSRLSTRQLSELRNAIDAKLDIRPAAILSEEESAFISRLFQA